MYINTSWVSEGEKKNNVYISIELKTAINVLHPMNWLRVFGRIYFGQLLGRIWYYYKACGSLQIWSLHISCRCLYVGAYLVCGICRQSSFILWRHQDIEKATIFLQFYCYTNLKSFICTKAVMCKMLRMHLSIEQILKILLPF